MSPGAGAGAGRPGDVADRTGLALPVRSVVPVVFAVAAVLAEVAYPLTAGATRDRLTVLTVLAFFLASAGAAVLRLGPARAGALVAVTAGLGLAVEALGTATGVPFGDYRYAGSLGWRLLDVPVIIPLAWTMMAYPAYVAARWLTGRRAARVVVGAVALASWDLFLDPQMVSAGHWRWLAPEPHLPGVPDIPISNYLGWLGTALLIMAILVVVLPDRSPDPVADAVPLALYLWTYASSVLANLVFFGRPAVALIGGVVMGLVALPLAGRVIARRRQPEPVE